MDETHPEAWSGHLPNDAQGTDAPKSHDDTLPVPLPATPSGAGWDDAAFSAQAATWRPELLRWLATLNPGRTQTEYQKAVGYFFETPGVPQQLDDLTFDLLLAYRGALALRATAHQRGPARRGAPQRPAAPAIAGAAYPRLASGGDDETGRAEGTDASAQASQGPLSPATVNLRLTALRQFLVHCSLMGSLPQLSPDRVRGALRRMSVERRRPYQVLSEQEWTDFLEAARLPASVAMASVERRDREQDGEGHTSSSDTKEQRGPWGKPRALRQSAVAEPGPASHDSGRDGPAAEPALPRSHAGLTGRYTAERDYALVSLALATGLRAIELAELDVGDLVREWQGGVEEWWLVLPDAKTKGQHGGRTLPLAPPLIRTLLAYIVSTDRRWEREEDRTTPLFLAGRRQRLPRPPDQSAASAASAAGERRLSPQQIRAIVDRVETQWLALREAKLEAKTPGAGATAAGETRKISPHALRHSTAIALLSGNDASGRPPASVEHVRGWLGHFDIRTTQGYLAHLDARRHRRPFTLTLGEGRGEALPDDTANGDGTRGE